jgi:hypothetical protein
MKDGKGRELLENFENMYLIGYIGRGNNLRVLSWT